MTKPKTDKPKTTMSKQYVIQRVEARVASIKSRHESNVQERERIVGALAQRRRNWARGVGTEYANRVSALIEHMANPDMDARVVSETASSLETTLRELKEKVPYYAYPETDRIREMDRENTNSARELAAIEHALAYLKEVEIEEFSLTALQRLGLLDTVKFSLQAK